VKRSLILALFIAVGATAWVLSGNYDLLANGRGDAADQADPSAKQASPAEAPKTHAVKTVRTKVLIAKPRVIDIIVRGRTRAFRTVDIKAEVHGRVVAIKAVEGQRVKKGDVLVKLGTEDREARIVETRAMLVQRELEYEAAKVLRKKGYRAATQLAASAAQLDAARAQLKRMQVEFANLTLRAPFDGIVEMQHAELGAFLKIGGEIVRIVDEDPFLVTGQVSERDVAKLRVGGAGAARLVDGRVIDGKIRFIATTADQATRTFLVELEVPNKDRNLRDGMTAEIKFEGETVIAHFVSPAALTLNDDGDVGVRSVSADGVVQFWPARIIGDAEDGIWLAGLPNKLTLITVGHEFVREGDKVEVMIDNPGPTS